MTADRKKNRKKELNNSEAEEIILPTTEELRRELSRENRRKEYNRTFRGTIVVLIVVAAAAVLVSSFFIQVLKVSGESMRPTLETGQIVVAVKTEEFTPGQMIAFYYNNKALIKRVVGSPGDWISIDEYGNVTVNGVALDEPYLTEKSLQPTDIEFPYQVPENRYFVLGDNRSVSIDSRSDAVGCVSKEQLIGHVAFRIYPFVDFGKINNS